MSNDLMKYYRSYKNAMAVPDKMGRNSKVSREAFRLMTRNKAFPKALDETITGLQIYDRDSKSLDKYDLDAE